MNERKGLQQLSVWYSSKQRIQRPSTLVRRLRFNYTPNVSYFSFFIISSGCRCVWNFRALPHYPERAFPSTRSHSECVFEFISSNWPGGVRRGDTTSVEHHLVALESAFPNLGTTSAHLDVPSAAAPHADCKVRWLVRLGCQTCRSACSRPWMGLGLWWNRALFLDGNRPTIHWLKITEKTPGIRCFRWHL